MTRTIVVKIGSNAMARRNGPDPVLLTSAMDAAITATRSGCNCVLVSSGAVSSGGAFLGRFQRVEISSRLASAVGQPLLMDSYRFVGHLSGSVVGQLLVSDADLRDPLQMRVLAGVIAECFALGVIPIVNGNDVSDPSALDNDAVAAVIAVMIGADKLLILTDVPGVLANPDDPSSAITELGVSDLQHVLLHDDGKGRGGMRSKIRVAELASHNGIETHIASATLSGVVQRCIQGETVGTRVLASGRALDPTMRWIAGVLTSHGRLTVNKAAEDNIIGGSSLFASGIKRVSGNFNAGDVVDIRTPAGVLVARGVSRASSQLLSVIRALQTTEIALVFAEIVRNYAAISGCQTLQRDDTAPLRPQVGRAVDAIQRCGFGIKRQMALEVIGLFPNAAVEAMVGVLDVDPGADAVDALRERYSRMSSDLSFIDRSQLAVFEARDHGGGSTHGDIAAVLP